PEDLLHLLLGPSDHLHLRHAGQFSAHHRGLGQRVAGPPFLADGEVIEPFPLVGVPQRTAPLGDRHPRPPLRSPVRTVVDGRRGTVQPFLHLNRLNRGNAVVVLGEPVRLVAVEIDPFDAVALAATRRHHIHRRHRRPPSPLVGLSLPAPDGHVRQTGAGDRGRQLAEIDRNACLQSSLVMEITMEIVSLLWIYSPVTSSRCCNTYRTTRNRRTLVTETYFGSSTNQIAHA